MAKILDAPQRAAGSAKWHRERVHFAHLRPTVPDDDDAGIDRLHYHDSMHMLYSGLVWCYADSRRRGDKFSRAECQRLHTALDEAVARSTPAEAVRPPQRAINALWRWMPRELIQTLL